MLIGSSSYIILVIHTSIPCFSDWTIICDCHNHCNLCHCHTSTDMYIYLITSVSVMIMDKHCQINNHGNTMCHLYHSDTPKYIAFSWLLIWQCLSIIMTLTDVIRYIYVCACMAMTHLLVGIVKHPWSYKLWPFWLICHISITQTSVDNCLHAVGSGPWWCQYFFTPWRVTRECHPCSSDN
jgi:hypothetical protein